MEKDLPKLKDYSKDKYVKESIDYCRKTLNNKDYYINNGIKLKDLKTLKDGDLELIFSINHKDSKSILSNFVSNALEKFGDYQDAFLKDNNHSLLFHSGISVMMNVGLLTPNDVIDTVIRSYNRYSSKRKKDMLNNVEGFIRQILGWREFSQYIYQFHFDKMDNKNFFNSKNNLSKKWYDGKTNSKPIDECIKKGFKYGYLHHIERLMVMANYMVISEIKPKEMFKWFSEFALDSYDWVMYYNIYCMASYADGGNFTTKPYISSSNYIFKMSNYSDKKENEDWSKEWDKKFWMFMDKHKKKIKKINRLGMLLKHADKNLKELKDVKLFDT
jgi:deoxyribodipyrimidine photolyase-related protein